MFKWFQRREDPSQRLTKRYERLLREARDLQRAGDIQGFAARSAEAEAVRRELERVEGATHGR